MVELADTAGKKQDDTAEKEKDFFVRIFRRMATGQFSSISGILEETGAFFGFYSGFVYEADHAGVFHLCEFYHASGEPTESFHLPDGFILEDSLDKASIADLLKQTGEIVYLKSRKNRLGRKFLELFGAQTLVMIPVLFSNRPVAFVGLLDRRRPVRLSQKEIDDADAVLSVLAQHVETRVYRKRLELAYGTLKNVVDKTGVDIYVSDYNTGEVLFANESLAESFGGLEKVLGRPCWKVFSGGSTRCPWCPRDKLDFSTGEQESTTSPNVENMKPCSMDFQRPSDGSWFHVLNAAFRWVDGRLAHVISSVNITESKKNEDLVKKLAETDGLTGLPNRRKFMEDFELSLENAKKEGRRSCLLFMDLDDFKSVNDIRGHLAGDGLLEAISSFLLKAAAKYGKAYRYGGDELVIIAEDTTGAELEAFKDVLLSHFDKGWKVDGKNLRCGVSIGAVLYPEGNEGIKELIRRADETMYEVKRGGKHGFRLSGPPKPRRTGSSG
jgi:diguanylate cyclase (GGDEF)-like protein